MTSSPSESDKDTLRRNFLRHVVPIYFDLRRGDEQHQLTFTAFAFSVNDQWLLMTAGHCITEMEEIRGHGYDLVKCKLLDSLNPKAQFDGGLPFDYDGAHPLMLGKHYTWDYGILFLADNTRQLLAANRVVPFDERWWASEPDQVASYYLIGIPEELTQTSPTKVTVGVSMARLEKVDTRPEGFPDTEAPMFYGRLLENPLSSLKGFSGSPIMSFGVVDGQARYWLHAMQVSALRGKYVSGMVVRPLGELLRQIQETPPEERQRG